MNFDEAFAVLLELEGDYVNRSTDPGGETRWGITKKVASANGYIGDMRLLPKEVAARIYRTKYWELVRADDVPPLIRYPLFDAAVHSGPVQSIKWLQAQIGVADVDGWIGPETIKATWAADPQLVAIRMVADRLQFLTSLPTWAGYGRGWARRIVTLLRLCSEST